MKTLHLFAGAGGGIIADMILGHTPICAVEIDPYCRSILRQRQEDGLLPYFPIYEDVRYFDGFDYKGLVDCVCGGFPCQDISPCGNGEGITGKRSGLFFELTRICRNIRPRYIFLENSPFIISRGLDSILGEIASMRYDSEWLCLPASSVGAKHERMRWWCLCRDREISNSDGTRPMVSGPVRPQPENTEIDNNHPLPNTDHNGTLRRDGFEAHIRQSRSELDHHPGREKTSCYGLDWFAAEPGLGRMANGVPDRVDRIKALGNAQVPACAAAAFLILYNRFNNTTN